MSKHVVRLLLEFRVSDDKNSHLRMKDIHESVNEFHDTIGDIGR